MAGIVGVGVGLLLATALSNNGTEQRAAFARNLSTRLEARGIRLLASELARASTGVIWVLTLQLASQHVMTLHAPVNGQTDPFSMAASADIAERVAHYIETHGA
jgi:hypothetical protein